MRNIKVIIFHKIVCLGKHTNNHILNSHNREFLEICRSVFCIDQKLVTQFGKPW